MDYDKKADVLITVLEVATSILKEMCIRDSYGTAHAEGDGVVYRSEV